MSANDWLSGKDKKPALINLQPEGMDACKYIDYLQ